MLSVKDIGLTFGHKKLFENVNIVFTPGYRYGIIGANGTGKSTFLKIISGEQSADKGSIFLDPKAKLGWLRQDHFRYDQETVLNTVFQGDQVLWKVMKEREDLYAKGDLTDKEANRLGELEGEFMELDGYSAEAKASEFLVGLGIPDTLHQELMKEIPIQYKFRVLLAQILFQKPDVMLLDEPTNNLDIRTISWLENYLNDYEGTILIVSHDRHFINSVCTHIADIDFGEIRIYTGDYDYYQMASSIARDQKLTEQAKKEKRAAELKSFIARFGANKSKARQATSRQKQLDAMEMESIRPSSRVYPRIYFKPQRDLGKDVVRFEDVTASYDGGKTTVLQKFNLFFSGGEKVGIIGPSGVGKTTFMRLLSGELAPQTGAVHWGVTTHRAYCPQDTKSYIPKNMTLFQWLHDGHPDLDMGSIRGVLGRMLFAGEDGDKKTEVLSGGEGVRLTLSKMMLDEPNVLLLDEPTSHLDLESIESLNESLKQFPGTAFFVSHDRTFISSVANRILEIFPDGSIQDFQGNYEDYLQWSEKKK
ncbi:MAG: ATP-binding cassette domain-containing protein [Oligoflexia bacterium]|nr:ATP-binding cassette domain-containing protein [Oligoflexia bacterium]